MNKQAGLWIDHRRAIIVTLTDGQEETKHIENAESSNSNSSEGEDTRDRKTENQHHKYYDEVITYLGDASAIHIFGPGEAKGELEKRIEHAGHKDTIITVETTDKLTDNQIAAKAREHFSN